MDFSYILMPQLYLFIAATILIAAILGRRNIIETRRQKELFKAEIANKVEHNRKLQQEETKVRFKDELQRDQRNKKFDSARYRDEMRKADFATAKKQWTEAKKHLIQAISVSENEVEASLKLAQIYMETNDYRRAETLYHRLLELDPQNPAIYESIGRILIKKKRYKEAIQSYVRAVELDEKDDQKFLALGKLYHLLMHYSLAAECFRRAAELKPRDVSYLFLLADSCKADEDFDNALFTYEKILTVEPYNERAKQSAQEVRLQIKQFESFLAHKNSVSN